MKLFARDPKCCPGANATKMTSMRTARRGQPPQIRQSQMVFHRFAESTQWHWLDQADNLTRIAP